MTTTTPRWTQRIGLSLVLVGLGTACAKQPSPDDTARTAAVKPAPPAPPPPPDPAAEARELFQKRCVVCHGDHGAGDGPGAAALQPKPRAFGDADWQASVTDEHIKKTIVEGGPAVGKSPAMAANPELKGKPEQLDALVKIVRGFKH